MFDIFHAVEYLHKQSPKIIHRDIKPENILFFSGKLKLADFGSSNVKDRVNSTTMCGTPEYISPEMMLKQGHDEKLDIWALGILVYELLTGETPFAKMIISENATKAEIFNSLANFIISEEIYYPPDLSPEALSLLKFCLMKNPAQRASAYECVRHEFFTNKG